MGTIELEFDFLPGASPATEWYAQAAFGVVIELALQAAHASSAAGLRELRFGAALVLDSPRRCVARCDGETGRVEVTSMELAPVRPASATLLHLVALLDRGQSSSTAVQGDAYDLGRREPQLDALKRFRDVADVRRTRELVVGLDLHARGLRAALLPGVDDAAAYAVHPLLATSALELVRFWSQDQERLRVSWPRRAARLELVRPGADVACIELLRVETSDSAVMELVVSAETSNGLAWRLVGLELQAAGRTRDEPAAATDPPGRGQLSRALSALPDRARRAHCALVLREMVSAIITRPEAELAAEVPLRDLGVTSRATVELAAELSQALGKPLAPSFVFDHPTLDRLLAAVLALEDPAMTTVAQRQAAVTARAECGVAVVGMACRLPGGVSSPERAWELMCDGVDTVGPVPAQRIALAPSMARHALPAAFLDDIELFDAAFFATGEREAAAMDPQHRLLLEVTWEALERAGIVPAELAGTRTGVFVSAAPFGYSQLVNELDAFTAIGNEPSAAAGRLSYFLGLHGPCMCVDAACASSLVAACLASDALRRGEIDLAIVAGVNLLLDPLVTEGLVAGGVLSGATNRCRAFDAAADGYVRSEACGAIVLRRDDDARRRSEPVLAVIRGYAVTHAGRSNGLGAPSREAQIDVIRLALANAGIAPGEIGYVEAHGTGTALGDALELQAVSEIYGAQSARTQPVLLGSLKTNIGHTEFAAGITGLIKAVLLAQHDEIPPHLHFEQPAPAIDWSNARVEVARTRRAWPAGLARRIIGVNALGISGTYAHMLVEASAPAARPAASATVAAEAGAPHVVAVNAANERALRSLAGAYAEYLAGGGTAAELAATTLHHRQQLQSRALVIGKDTLQLQAALRAIAAGERPRPPRSTRRPKIAFLYSGLGAQYGGMGAALIAQSEVFRAAIAECDRLLVGRMPCSLFDVMRPGADADRLLQRSHVSQPAIFALEHALTQLWRSWGIEPDVVMGHSLGELAAAHVAGVLSLDDALQLVAERGRLMDTVAGGAMAVVDAAREDVELLLGTWPGALWLAAVNAPNQLVISGTLDAVESACAKLERSGARARRLAIPLAAHSGCLDPILDEFERQAERAHYRAPNLPIVSSMSGTSVQLEMSSARYFRQQMRAPVEFARAMATLAEQGVDAFVELGPHSVLIGPAAACVDAPDKLFAASMSRDREPLRQLLDAAGELYAAGAELVRAALPGPRAAHDPRVPTYAFQRRRYWVRSPRSSMLPSDIGEEAVSAVEPVPPTASGLEQRSPQFSEHDAVARLERLIKDELGKILDIEHEPLDLERSFGEIGLGSLGAVQLRSCVQRWVGRPLPLSIIAGDKTARDLAREAWTHATRAA
jgi:acyl transferase domain-containing protein